MRVNLLRLPGRRMWRQTFSRLSHIIRANNTNSLINKIMGGGGGANELYSTTHISYHYACNEGCYRKDYILVIQYSEEETQHSSLILLLLLFCFHPLGKLPKRHQVKCEQKARHIPSFQLFGVIILCFQRLHIHNPYLYVYYVL